MKPQIILLSDVVLFGEYGSTRYSAPYSLAGQLMDEGFDVFVIDYFTSIPNFFEYIENFLSPRLLFIGISSTFLAPFNSVLNSRAHRSVGIDRYYSGELWYQKGAELRDWLHRLKTQIQGQSPRAKLILGGTKAQFALWRPEYYDSFDWICLGAADQALIDFAHNLVNQRPLKTKEILGRQVLDNSSDILSKRCPHFFWSRTFAPQPGEALPIEVARGCAFNCKYCHYDKRESFKKDISLLKAELLHNYEQFGTTTYHFCDDCFNDHPKKVEDYCRMFLSLPFAIEWVAYARPDVAVKFPHSLELMIRSGAKGLYFGIESFNHTVARRAGKGTPTECIQRFLLDFKSNYSADCLLEGSFIVGLPGETIESQLATRDWILANDVFDFFTIGPLGIMPYVASLDHVLVDYADYSRNPAKYGFTNVDFQKRYWEHETFSSESAAMLATEIKSAWSQRRTHQKFKTVWLYPHMRTLGFSSKDAFRLVRDPEFAEGISVDDIAGRFDQFKSRFWSDLTRMVNSEGEWSRLNYHRRSTDASRSFHIDPRRGPQSGTSSRFPS